MSLLDYLTNYYVLLLELAGLMILSFSSVHMKKQTLVLIRVSVVLILLESLAFYFERWTHSFETLSLWRPFLTACVYTLLPVILIVIMQVTVPFSKFRLWLLIPLAVSIVLYFSSQWTKAVFFFTEENHYTGGAVPLLPYIIFGFYFAVFLVQTVLYTKKYPMIDRVIAMVILSVSFFGGILFKILNVQDDNGRIFAAALLLYYLALYVRASKFDPLTGLMNRQCYYRDYESSTRRPDCVLSVDMNGLKLINDTSGHEAGDKALLSVANCLRKNSGRKKKVYRVGGDEFIVFYYGMNESEAESDVAMMREELGKTGYTCAFGIASVRNSDNIQTAVSEADGAMYLNKAEIKNKAEQQS